MAVIAITTGGTMAMAQSENWTVQLPRPAKTLAISVADFGARPDSGKCAWQAFKDAIEACRTQKASMLVIPKGRYIFDSPSITKGQPGQIMLQDLADLTIDGQGSELVFHHIVRGIKLARCQRVKLMNLVIDWDVTMASPGIVHNDADGTGKVIKILDEYPITPDTPVTAVTEYDIMNTRWKMAAAEVYYPKDVKVIGRQTYASPSFKSLANGMSVCVRHYVYQAPAVDFGGQGNSNLTFENITIYSCPGAAFTAFQCDRGFRIAKCRIMLKPGTKRIVSATADGAWFGTTKGAIIVEDCDFSHQGDDSVNIHGRWLRVVEKTDSRTMTVNSKWGEVPCLSPGDELRFCRAGNMAEYARAKVVSATWKKSEKVSQVEVEAELPGGMAIGDFIANVNRSSPEFIVRNNYFHDHRARGMLIQARNGAIENNRIERVMAAAFQLTTDGNYWHEGYGCENVIVRSNRIATCNYATWERGEGGRHMACINLVADVAGGISDAPVHRNVTIEGNTIKDTAGLAILVGSCENVSVRNNTIVDANTQPFAKTGEAINAKAGGSIMVTRATKVTVTGNKQTSTRKTYADGVYVDNVTTRNVVVDTTR